MPIADNFCHIANFFQVVAILGAHTLGNSELRNTGHSGSWTPSEEDVFNVTYYENMATKPLKWINKVRYNIFMLTYAMLSELVSSGVCQREKIVLK